MTDLLTRADVLSQAAGRPHLRVSFHVPGDRLAQIDRILFGMGDAVKDLSPAFGAMADDLQERITPAQFKTQGARGEPMGWATLTAAYAARKRKAGFGTRTLQRTGRLVSALTGQSRGDSVRQITADSLRVGVNDATVPYAKYHQSGTLDFFGVRQKIGFGRGRGMPVRAPIQLTEADRAKWMRAIRNLILSANEAKGSSARLFAETGQRSTYSVGRI